MIRSIQEQRTAYIWKLESTFFQQFFKATKTQRARTKSMPAFQNDLGSNTTSAAFGDVSSAQLCSLHLVLS